MSQQKRNVILIGMPGSGKSTLGRNLAKCLGKQFLDTDALIEQDQNMPIQAVVNRRGLSFMRSVEERVLCDLSIDDYVIATGGSAVYSPAAMEHLGINGIRVYLNINLKTLVDRVRDTRSRGLVKMPSYSLPRLYAERLPLYHAAADLVVSNNRPITAVSMDALLSQLHEYQYG